MAEDKFPTILDMHVALTDLIARGLGDLPVQLLLAPDSTLQALARNIDPQYQGKPALMIDLAQGRNGRLSVSIISADRLTRDGPPVSVQ